MQHSEYIEIRKLIRTAIEGTPWQGHVFLVGGCVRNELMGQEVKDIDIAVDLCGGGIGFAQWMQDKGLTEGRIVTFSHYGTAMFQPLGFPKIDIECVQTRKSKYVKGNNVSPDEAFGPIECDCRLRDLTINSLYRNISTDQLLDITGQGLDDLKNHVIRTTNTPDVIFDDDPLRVLRCIRFAAWLDWSIDNETLASMKRFAHLLNTMTKERIRNEMERIIMVDHPTQALELMRTTGVMHYVIPEFEKTYDMGQNKYHWGTAWQHTLQVVEQTPAQINLRWAALLHDIGKTRTRTVSPDGVVHFYNHESASADMAEIILYRLKYQTNFVRKVRFLVQHHMDTKMWGDDLSMMKIKHLRKLQYICRTEGRMHDLLMVIDADNKSHAPEFCLPNQVRLILEQNAKMVQAGEAFYEFTSPIPCAKVRKIKQLQAGSTALKDCMDYVCKLSLENPHRSPKEWEKLIRAYKPKE